MLDREKSGGKKKATQHAGREATQASARGGGAADQGGLFNNTDDEDEDLRNRLNPKLWFSRRVMAGSIIGTTLGLLMGVFTVVQGPLEFLQFGKALASHVAQLDDFMDEQRSQRMRYRRLSATGNIAADLVERRLNRSGFYSKYNSAGYFEGYRIDPRVVPPNDLAKLRGNLQINGDEILLVEPGSNLRRRGLINNVNDYVFKKSTLRRVNAKIAARMQRARGGVSFHFLGNIDRKVNTKFSEFLNRAIKQFAEYFKKGEGVDLPRAQGDTEGAEDERRASQGTADEINGSIDNAAGDLSDQGMANASNDVGTKLDAGKAGDFLGFVCASRAISKGWQAVLYSKLVIPMLRFGMAFLSIASQIMYGGQHTDREGEPAKATLFAELGAMSVLLRGGNGPPWASARTVQGAFGKPLTGPDMPNVSKLGRLNNKPAFFRIVDALPVGTACRVNDNVVGGFIISAASGGVVAEVIITGLAAFGFDPIGDGVNALIRWSVGNPLKDLPQRAQTANYAMTGMHIAASDQFASVGGRVMDTAETAELQQKTIDDQKAEFAKLPLSSRLFDATEPRSLAGQVIMDTPDSPSGMVASALTSLWTLPSTFMSRVAQTFSRSAYAASAYNYEYPMIAFSLAERTDERWADTNALEERVKPKLAEYNDKYGKCFSTTIEPSTLEILAGNTVNVYEDSYKNSCMITPADDEYEDFTDYRFFIANEVSKQADECQLNKQSECKILNPARRASTAPPAGSGNGLIVGDPYTDGTSVPCATGTQDRGMSTGYAGTGPGPNDYQTFPIRLCMLSNLPSTGSEDPGFGVVNSRVSGAWFALINQAAAAGVVLTGASSYRSMAHQQALWEQNRDDSSSVWEQNRDDSSSVAAPGKSSHQAGVALDFANMESGSGRPQECAARATATSAQYTWMRNNAARFGFKQYAAEAWHWDALQAGNRC